MKTSKMGKKSYFTSLPEAPPATSTELNIPLASEWITSHQDQYDKQDCEPAAFRHLAVKLKSRFPRLPVCILAMGDDRRTAAGMHKYLAGKLPDGHFPAR